MIAQRLLPAFAVLSVAAAQSVCSATGTATITNQVQAAAYTGCSTVRGSIVVSPDAVGSISLDGPEEILGNFVVSNVSEIVSVGSSSLTNIGGSFTLNSLTKLATLAFPRLEEVNEISWITLPALSTLAFTSNVTQASKVVIASTFLSTLNGINLVTVDVLDISNNRRLTEFSADLGNVTDSLVISNNGQSLDVSFPQLTWAAEMTFRNVSSVAIPKLQAVNGSLGFYGNYFEELKAPKLTRVGNFATGVGSLAFVANSELTTLELPVLVSVGGADQIANNTELKEFEFPALENVGGAVDFSGTFSTPGLPNIKDIRGGFNMQSKSEIDCSGFQALRSSQTIQGVFTCKSSADTVKSNDGTSTEGGTTTGSGTSSSATPSGSGNAAVSYGTNGAVVGMSVMGGLLSMLL